MSSVLDVQKKPEKPQYTPSLTRQIVTGIIKLWLVIVFVTCLLIGFLLTPFGTQTLVNTANSLVDELTINYQSGGVGSEVHLSSVKWKQPANQIDIDNLRLSIQLSCAWRLALCVDSVAADKIVVQIQTTPTSLTSPTPPKVEAATSAITLPFPVSVKNLSFNEFSLKVQDTADITWQKLTGKLDFYQRLRIEKMQLDGFNLPPMPHKHHK